MQYAKSVGYEISPEFMGKDRLLLKFLVGAKYDYVKAMRSMIRIPSATISADFVADLALDANKRGLLTCVTLGSCNA